jgi:hypothetical protein
MRKITLIAFGILLSIVFFGAESRARSNAITEAYLKAFGRPPEPKEIDYWKKADGFGNNSNKLIASLKNYLVSPQGEPELIGVINRSYMGSFARAPKNKENLYWKNEIYAKKFGYEDLIKFHREWLKSDKGSADRTYAITQGYLTGIGRAPHPGDLEYWREKIKQDGSNYTDIVNANITFILETGNHKEFIETVKRAYAAANLPAPSGSQITAIRLKIQDKPMVFSKLVEFVKNFKGTNKID